MTQEQTGVLTFAHCRGDFGRKTPKDLFAGRLNPVLVGDERAPQLQEDRQFRTWVCIVMIAPADS